jgi:hypothetical protein
MKKTEAKYILEAPKRLINITNWEKQNNRSVPSITLKFSSRVELDTELYSDIWFRCSKILGKKNEGTFILDQKQSNNRTHFALYRFDLNPSSFHTNGKTGPEELRGMFIPANTSHEHFCLDNYKTDPEILISDNIKPARPVELDFQNFNDALKYVCDKLKIENWTEIPPPIAQGELL